MMARTYRDPGQSRVAQDLTEARHGMATAASPKLVMKPVIIVDLDIPPLRLFPLPQQSHRRGPTLWGIGERGGELHHWRMTLTPKHPYRESSAYIMQDITRECPNEGLNIRWH